MTSPRFVHLRLHSEFSIADGTVRIDDAVAAAAADGMPALALTDLANAFGLIKFYKAARSGGVKPIFGCDVRVTHEARARPAVPDAAAGAVARRLPAGSPTGCRAPTAATSTAATRSSGASGSPRAPTGLIALSGGRDGDVGAALAQGNAAGAAKAAREWAALFPGPLLPRGAARRPRRRRRAGRRHRAPGRRDGPAGGRDAPGAVPAARRLPRARGARVHRRGLRAGRRAPAEAVHAGPVLQDAGRDGGGVRRPAGGARELGRDRAALQPHDPAGQELPARLPDARRRHARRAPARRSRGRPRAAPGAALPGPRGARAPAARVRREARVRDADHRPDGLRRLLPDRRRLHQLGEAQRRPGRAGARLGRGLARRLLAGHHRPRPAALRAAVRALPQPGARVDARLRHRLLPGRPRPRHRLREGQVRRRLGRRRSRPSARWPRRPRCATSGACSTSATTSATPSPS